MSPLRATRKSSQLRTVPTRAWDQPNARIRVVVLPNGIPQGLDHAFS
jgi:hypothetical protein